MSELLSRFSYDSIKINGHVIFCMVVIWLAVLGCGIASVFSQQWNRKQRVFWVLWMVCLPAIGLLSYLPFSIHAQRPTAVFSRKPKRRK